MNNLLKLDQDRIKLFKKYGYDILKSGDFILAKAKLTGSKILDVGTGRAHAAAALARKGFKVVSIDLDKEALKTARAKLKSSKLDKAVALKIMDADKLQYGNDYFDGVVSVNFIHHAKHPAKCLKEMIRVTKNKLVVADLNKRGAKVMEKVHALDGHKHAASRMSMPNVKEYLEKRGLSVKIYKDVCQTVIVAKKGE